ncbi:Acid phosphatase [Candida viswanathii]|uniref:Acid phosphatase n=1 Tax=Candida viswanathii TaxID=5486 RepID=A0A367Y0I3_9ASCO|nr:Acid phosphatase [Candida viswanathii]
MRLLALVALFCSAVHSLNILITNTDHWVGKNSRFLKTYLEKHGHQVRLIASAMSDSDSLPEYSREVTNYGPYEHLLPVHQSYYRKKQQLKNERPKKVMFKEDEVLQSNQYGQDPLDADCWYVNSNAFNTLQVGLNVILPSYYPDFTPDLVIIGPNEDIHNQYMLDTMMKATGARNISTIAVSTEDAHDVYYQDESYFHIGGSYHHQLKKYNVFTKNIRFVNKEIGKLVKSLHEDRVIGLDVKIPSINHEESHCLTSHHLKLKLKEIHSNGDSAVGYKFAFDTEKDNGFVKITDVHMEVEKPLRTREQEFFEIDTTEDEIVKGLLNCYIVVNVKYGEYDV